MIQNLWQTTSAYIRDGNLADTILFLEAGLAQCEGQGFKSLIGADFTNVPGRIVGNINDLINFCDRRFDVRAVYLEMNGFDINTVRWYFDSFAYRQYVKDPEDLDWLGERESPTWPDITLTGLEQVQADFERYSKRDGTFKLSDDEPAEHAMLLVMCKFGKLVQRSVSEGLVKHIPVLSTAHDYDIIARFGD